MKQLFAILIVFVLVTAACSTPAEQPTAEDPGSLTATQPPAATQADPSPVQESTQPVSEPAPELTQEPVPQTGSGGAVTYRIVSGESTVTYEVGETFFNQNNRFNVAIGTTSQVEGEITLDPANPQAASMGPITVDISRFTSDSARRDNALRERFLQTARFPTVTFTPTAIEGLPESYTEGQEIGFSVTGEATVRDTTRPVTFDVVASLSGDTLQGTATTTILMSDFGFGPIEMAGILGTEDEVKLKFDFVARQ